jgi:hypothetical protein
VLTAAQYEKLEQEVKEINKKKRDKAEQKEVKN